MGGTKFDTEKPRYELMSPFAMENLARVLTNGAKKYGDRNWEDGIKFSRIIGACERHIAAIKRGEDFDIGPKGDGELHSAHLLCEAMFLTEYYKIAPEFDDRPIRQDKRIGLDIDDVLCDFAGSYCREYGMDTPKSWQFDQKFKERYAELCDNCKWFLNLPRLCNPDELPFEPVVYITARGCDKAITEQWIHDNGFPTATVVQVTPGASKVDACREYKLEIFVDDSWNNFTELTNAGIFTYLFTREHNKRYNVGHRRLNRLQDIFMGDDNK